MTKFIIQRSQLSSDPYPTDDGWMPAVDASDIGLAPGDWPTTIRIHDAESTGRQTAVGIPVGTETQHGELVGVIYYASEWAMKFLVIND